MLPLYSVPVSHLCCEPQLKFDMLGCVHSLLEGEQCHQWFGVGASAAPAALFLLPQASIGCSCCRPLFACSADMRNAGLLRRDKDAVLVLFSDSLAVLCGSAMDCAKEERSAERLPALRLIGYGEVRRWADD